jgi:hypothetical protein
MKIYKSNVGKLIKTNARLQHLINTKCWILVKRGEYSYDSYSSTYIANLNYNLVIRWLNARKLFEYIKNKDVKK